MKHARAAREFLRNGPRTDWHDQALWYVRQKRDLQKDGIPDWEDLREQASAIKEHTLSNLDQYLEEFETNALRNGIRVHWALNAQEHNHMVLEILQQAGVNRLVKSKSMLTEECQMNPFLEKKGIEVIESDLGERIIQFAEQDPSHIVLPAIHMKKEEVGKLFEKKLGTKPGNHDPQYLTGAARKHLREHFLAAEVAMTGVNFALAESGGFVVCTNEGNADMGIHHASIHIASMGIEKVIPGKEHLAVFLRLLARSATGQPVTTYTSHFQRPDRDKEIHLIIVDNGRSEHLGKDKFWRALKCIRCGACLNTCPVYRRSGGHSYGYTIPGPIGSILTPRVDLKAFSDLPYASSLCGSCSDVCPVKIEIHEQLYHWRQEVNEQGELSRKKKLGIRFMGRLLARPRLYQKSGKFARKALRITPRFLVYNRLNPWGLSRDLPEPPRQSFQEWYRENRNKS
ncbi:MAG: 4Fe-4S ferredoxin [Bacteroides sp. SM23_62]|nr:MAG: 4Fe-4S ferredoxin [Bacteroides sp. SM23_62]